jgi:hypothetical protein
LALEKGLSPGPGFDNMAAGEVADKLREDAPNAPGLF